MEGVEDHLAERSGPLMGRDNLAVGYDHNPVDIALDRHQLEREPPRGAVATAIESDALIFVHGDRRADHTSVEPMFWQRRRGSLFRGEPRADHERARQRLNGSLPLRLAALPKISVQLIEVLHPRDRGREAALHSLDGALGVGLLVAPSRHAEEGVEDVVVGQRGVSGMDLSFASLKDQGRDRSGIVPPNFLGNGFEELEGGDHAFEDRLGALEGECQNERTIRVGPGGDQEGDLPSPLGKFNVDVAEVGFEAFAGEMT